MSTFAQRLRQLRGERKLSQKALGEAAKIGANTIYAYESGNERGPFPRRETLKRLAAALHCRPSALITNEERKARDGAPTPEAPAAPTLDAMPGDEEPAPVGPILGNGDVVKYKLAAFAAKRGDPIIVVARILKAEPPANDVDLDWWLSLYLEALKETGK